MLAIILALVIQSAPPKYADGLYAEIATNKGLFVVQLEFQKTPLTVSNFVGLAEGTINNAVYAEGTPFFNGCIFFRALRGRALLTGIPKGFTQLGPGYQFPNEIRPELRIDRPGVLVMANSGANTNGSQWGITLDDLSYLDSEKTVFGHVISGMEVVKTIDSFDELKSIKIVRVGEAAEKFRPTTDSFMLMVDEAMAQAKKAEEEKEREEEELIRKNWPQAKTSKSGVKYLILREGSGSIPGDASKVRLVYSGKTLKGGAAFVSTTDGTEPAFGAKPEPFTYVIGKTTINPGFDEAIEKMRVGEKRLIIVPSDMAYSRRGFLGKERKGEKQFFIPPQSIIVYEIEMLDVIR